MKRTFTFLLTALFLCIGTWAQSVAYKVAETQLSSSALNEKTEATMIAIKNLSATNNYYYVGNTGSAPYGKAEFNNNGEAVFVWEPVTEGTAGSYYLRKLDGTYMQKSAPKDFGTIDNAAVFTTTNPTSTGNGSTKFNGDGDSQAYINGNDDPNLVRFVNGDGKWINVQNGASGTPLYNTGLGGWTIHYVYAIETGEALDVIYKFTYEGEEKYTQTASALVGEEWPAITVAFPYGVSASKPEGVVEVEEAAPTTFYVKNALSGQYLSYDVASNLTAADGEAVATIVPSSVVAGTFAVSYPGPNGAADPRFVQCGSKGRFSGNANLTKNSSIYLYKVTGEGTATRVNTVEDGASYIFVAECSKEGYEGYWMVTNELFGEGADLRMIGVKVSDELADEITFEVGDYSPVWTVGVAEVEEVEAAEFYVKNAASGKYLDFDPASNLTTGDAEAVATISPSSLVAGTFGISYPDPTGQTGVRYVQCGSYGRFSGNSQLTKNSSIYLYKVTGEGAASRVEAIEAGASYIFVAECSKSGYEGYWMLTNETTGEGDALRMIGVKVSDELPGDEITFEQGEYSPVWTIKPVEKEEETVAITKVIELEVGELPFEAAETVEGITQWYYAKLHSNTPKYIQALENDTIECSDTEVVAGEEDSHLWAFVGNVWSMKMVNKTGKAIVSTGGIAKLGDTANATDFTVMPSKTSAEGFCMQYSNKSYLNGPQNNIVQSWADNDAGSTFLLEEYVEVAALAEIVGVTPAEGEVAELAEIIVQFSNDKVLPYSNVFLVDEIENVYEFELDASHPDYTQAKYVAKGGAITAAGTYTLDCSQIDHMDNTTGQTINPFEGFYSWIIKAAAPAFDTEIVSVTPAEGEVAELAEIIVQFSNDKILPYSNVFLVDEVENVYEFELDANHSDYTQAKYVAKGGAITKAGTYTLDCSQIDHMDMMTGQATNPFEGFYSWIIKAAAPAFDTEIVSVTPAEGEVAELAEIIVQFSNDKILPYSNVFLVDEVENVYEFELDANHSDYTQAKYVAKGGAITKAGTYTLDCSQIDHMDMMTGQATNPFEGFYSWIIKAAAPAFDTEIVSVTPAEGEVAELAEIIVQFSNDKILPYSNVFLVDEVENVYEFELDANHSDYTQAKYVAKGGAITKAGTYTLDCSQIDHMDMMTGQATNPFTGTFSWTIKAVEDGIDNINADTETVIYDIHGRRVTEMTKGVYIVNGKKVIKK